MAKFCDQCGAALNPDSKFCPECGARIVKKKDNGIRIKEDGKGGLIFEVPEGTTVEISDTVPKK